MPHQRFQRFDYLSVYQFIALSWKKGVSCKIPIFTNTAFSFYQNFIKPHNFPVFLRLFNICVADQKPQTIISFFSIHNKLSYRKRGLNDKLKHKLYER